MMDLLCVDVMVQDDVIFLINEYEETEDFITPDKAFIELRDKKACKSYG